VARLAVFLRKYPLIVLALSIAAAAINAKFGGHHGKGLWDGPV
jgi:hypothetical protein